MGNVELDRFDGPWSAYSGLYSTDLATDKSIELSQGFKIKSGIIYTIEFALFGNPKCGGSKDKTGTVSIVPNRNGIKKSFDFTYTADSGWTLRSFEFTSEDVGKHGKMDIVFTATNGASCGVVIDKVSITPNLCPKKVCPKEEIAYAS